MTAELQQDGEESGAESQGTNSQMLLNQLREITGIQDASFLHEALKASNGDITQAVSLLTDERAIEPGQDPVAAEPTDGEGSAVGKEVPANVIDLTYEKKGDLQAAITFSLQESPKPPAEEQDSNRAHETNAAENKNRCKRKRCEVWGGHPNPSEWRRADDWPVGLKNIGNTCWFSAVIQSLFQLPEFRRLVLGYSLPQSVLENCQSRSEKRNIAFMQELQCLFALLVGSNRKFVDPSAALELLKDAFRSAEAQQQDVSEFTHKLLDWLEDAFQLAVNIDSPRDKSENPMVQLFYGTFLTEGIHEGKKFSNIETFGQYPLQVNGFRKLSECLESAMVEGEIEAHQSHQSMQYGQERWFTKLPPVLTFELSRFEFNQSLGQPEKIHSKLEFPQVIYMDRYLYRNKELIQRKRAKIRKMKTHIAGLQQKLERYMKYGSGPSHVPLPDLLQYVLEFASTKSSILSTASPTLPQTSPARESSVFEAAAKRNGPGESESNDHSRGVMSSPSSPSAVIPSVHAVLQEPLAQTLCHPAPRVVTEEELHYVVTCLQRWRTEVEQDIQDLKDCIARVNQSIDEMYADPALGQIPYRLHAVLVHEGQANAGHYWAYIYSHSKKVWMKYNDISVTESAWEELERDSYGGLRDASAYCLMYINNQLPHLAEEIDMEAGRRWSEAGGLSPGLKRYVREDNQRFDQEVEEWEEQHSCKIPPLEPGVTLQSNDFSSAESDGAELSSGSVYSERSLSSEHAMIAKEQTAQAIANTADSFEKNGVEVALKEPTEPNAERAWQPESELPVEAEHQQGASNRESDQQASSQISEVEIPSVGKILVRSDADGYNEEVMLSPAMQGVILAMVKARQAFDRDGPEAGLVKAFHEEYSRLRLLSQEEPTPHSDPRLQHVLVFFFQNEAPERVIERTLLEQFADKNLSYDERSISIMKVARAKLREIGPDDMDMEDYKKWHEDYSLFRKVSVYLLTGLELYQNGKCQEALTYLVYAYQNNTTLLVKGMSRGVEESLIALYRRKCLLELNDTAASLFESSQEASVAEGVSIMNELVIPCMHLIINNDISKEDLEAIEVIRSCWCSYLGQDIDENLRLKLGEFLPRLLDCSAEIIVLKEPPRIRPHSPYDLCSRFAAVMESIHGVSAVTVK
ncbi:ubiquitin carboxyl-terminal hydrolase 28 isoform X2 [Rhinatrema bivittatum]|uniref:ubiquitin carboxyl-terminal hydrolase 28 isoform X2 n=1 Tax=Rhinatrema bivittatum TaxID=194408 RepID=UPI00112A61D4|nr:ubiquitin carboxyl-terminal hydrolase 28 isoform X2 [Rhinatrema bivittatum]